MHVLTKIGVYGLIALIIGFALMAYEMVASRILAPTIGSSIYVWTSIIGVIIAALSVGYAIGGRLADRRVQPADIALLLLLSAGSVLLTALSAPVVLGMVASALTDPRIQGVMAALWLFAPTSLLIGMISPYLARLKTESVATTGQTIASLSALNAIGGITGTFITGFIFFAYIGATQTLLLISLLLLAASWTIRPATQLKLRLAASMIIILLSALTATASSIREPGIAALVDTPSARYRVIDTIYQGRPIRALASGPGGLQSGIYLDGSSELTFSYTRKIAQLVDAADNKKQILVLGGGTYTLPEYLAGRYPQSRIDVVEIDHQLADVARQYFDYSDPKNVHIFAEDARAYLNRSSARYDIVIVDVYSDTLIPPTVATVEYAAELLEALTPKGLVVANIIGSEVPACRPLLQSLHASYLHALPNSRAYPLIDLDLRTEQNIIIAYSKDRAALNPLPSQGSRSIQPGTPFSDNYAPVEHLKHRCSSEM